MCSSDLIGTLVLVWLSQKLALQGNYALVVQGGILIAVMMLLPEGVVIGLVARGTALRTHLLGSEIGRASCRARV